MSWLVPDGNGANNYGGSNGGLQGRSTRRGNNNNNNNNKCCFAGQAVKAVWMKKFKLARRFARLDVKTRLGLI